MATEFFDSKFRKNVYVKENNVFVCVDGVPTALKRHRTRIRGNYAQMYDSQKHLKNEVLKRVIMQLPSGFKPFECPIEFLVEFHMPIPKSFSSKKKMRMTCTPHIKVPDLSNLIKFFEDTFNGVLYSDDKLIVKIKATKINSEDPKTIICIREYESEDSYIEELKKGKIEE